MKKRNSMFLASGNLFSKTTSLSSLSLHLSAVAKVYTIAIAG